MLGAGIALLGLALAAPADSLSARTSVATPAFVLVPRDTFAPPGVTVGHAFDLSGIACDAFGRVLVTDAGLHRLIRFDADGTLLSESGALGSGTGMMRRPRGIAALGGLRVAVLDTDNRRVLAYDLEGRLEGTIVSFVEPELEDVLDRIDPVAIAADAGGALYIADAEQDRLLQFDFSGRYVRTVAGLGEEPGSFRGLRGVAVRPHGDLLTTERAGARVQRLDAGGRVLGGWPLEVKAGTAPLPIAADDSIRVAVADPRSGKVWVFDAGGTVLAEATRLDAPRALAFAPDGTLLVATTAGVLRFALVPRRAGDPAREP